MPDIQPYLQTKQDEIEVIAKRITDIVLADDNGCRDLIDTRIMLTDTAAQIDSAILLHNQPLQAQIDEVNQRGQGLKKVLQTCADLSREEIYRYMKDTGAQRIKSGAETAFFRENKDKLTLEIDQENLPEEFWKQAPDEKAIKDYYKATGKAPAGVIVTATDQDDTLIFKAVK